MAKKRQPKAKTAYELLERVCEAIEAHPLSYYQDDWVVQGYERPRDLCRDENTCDTAFCRAGWMVALHDGVGQWSAERISARAEELLGMSEGEAWPLFSTYELFHVDAKTKPGTPEYVREGVRGTREFMAQHEAHLRARKLRGVPRSSNRERSA